MVHAKSDADMLCVRPTLPKTNVTLVTEARVLRLLTSASGREVTAIVAQVGGKGLEQGTKAIGLLLDKSVQSAKASAFFCYLCGGLSAVAAVAAWFMLPSPFLICFAGACTWVLFAADSCYQRVARKQ